MAENVINTKSNKRLTWYKDVGTKVSYGSFRVITPQTPSTLSRLTSDGNGTAPSSINWNITKLKQEILVAAHYRNYSSERTLELHFHLLQYLKWGALSVGTWNYETTPSLI